MRALPTTMIRVLVPFAPLFSDRVFEHVQVLIAGAILTPGKRTVSSALRAMGLDEQKTFHRYHRVLSRAKWSSMEASRVLLDSLVEAFMPEGPLVVGVDETLERRQGKRIAAKGIYRLGRPRLKGSRLPSLSAVLEDSRTAWTPITVSGWYGGAQRLVEIVSETAVWYSTGSPAVPHCVGC